MAKMNSLIILEMVRRKKMKKRKLKIQARNKELDGHQKRIKMLKMKMHNKLKYQ
jgi:hypothetical protein